MPLYFSRPEVIFCRGMDATAKKIIGLLSTTEPELRVAAVRILPELGVNSSHVIHSLARCLREEPEELRILALKALARLGAKDVAETVVPLILESGALREHAMAVAAAVGTAAIPQLRALYVKGDFHGKRSVSTVISQIGGRAAFEFLLDVLPTEPFELQKHLTRCICEALDPIQSGAQTPLYRTLTRFIASKRVQKDHQILVAGLIILGYFHGERLAKTARGFLLRYSQKNQPPEIRRHALVSFHRLLMEGPPTPDQVLTLEKLLCDEDWHNVAQHALVAFQRVALPRPRVLKLLSLLDKSPHFSVHIHVFDRLRGHDHREVARAIIPFLNDGRFRVRDAAEVALRSIPSAIENLFAVLMHSEDSEVCQRVKAILREYPQEVKRRYVEKATQNFITLFEQNDTRYEAFFDYVRAIDVEPLRQKIYQKTRSLKSGRSKDKWIKIGGYLQILWDHHLITTSGRYLFAVALIKQSSKDLSPPARRANLGLRVIRALIYDDTPGLIEAILKDKDIGQEEIFYTGFHFMEEGEEMRPFARSLLDYLLQKYPKSKLVSPARQKLVLHAAVAAKTPPAKSGKAKGVSKGTPQVPASAQKPAKGEADPPATVVEPARTPAVSSSAVPPKAAAAESHSGKKAAQRAVPAKPAISPALRKKAAKKPPRKPPRKR